VQAQHEGKTPDEGNNEPRERGRSQRYREVGDIFLRGDPRNENAQENEREGDRGHRNQHVPFLKDDEDEEGEESDNPEELEDDPHVVGDNGQYLPPLHDVPGLADDVILFLITRLFYFPSISCILKNPCKKSRLGLLMMELTLSAAQKENSQTLCRQFIADRRSYGKGGSF